MEALYFTIKMVPCDTAHNVVGLYLGFPCMVMVGSTAAYSECKQAFYIKIFGFSALKISSWESQYHWNCFFEMQPRHFLRRCEKFLSIIAFLWSLLRIILCTISLMITYHYLMEQSFSWKWRLPFLCKEAFIVLQNRSCHVIRKK